MTRSGVDNFAALHSHWVISGIGCASVKGVNRATSRRSSEEPGHFDLRRSLYPCEQLLTTKTSRCLVANTARKPQQHTGDGGYVDSRVAIPVYNCSKESRAARSGYHDDPTPNLHNEHSCKKPLRYPYGL